MEAENSILLGLERLKVLVCIRDGGWVGHGGFVLMSLFVLSASERRSS